jgi:hypothetical protein
MIQSTFRLPERAGVIHTLPASDLNTKVIIKNSAGKDENCYPIIYYGMYHAIVYKSDDDSINNLFVFAKNNFYTHFDLRCAQKLNLRIELIQDGAWNAYIYPNDTLTIRGDYYFGNFVSTLYELKKLIPKVKLEVLNPLWGYMCKKNRTKKVYCDRKPHDIYESGYELKSIECVGNDLYEVISENKTKRFSSNFARMVFLTSYGRMKLVDKILPYKNDIVKIHTDSITVTKELHELKLDETTLGGWKLEAKKSGHFEILNVNIMSPVT